MVRDWTVCTACLLCLISSPVLSAQPPGNGAQAAPREQAPHERAPEGDAAGAETPSGPEAIQQQQPSFLVRAEVNHATRTYREGEGLTLRVTCEVDAFIYVVYKQADGKLYQIFPNSDQPDNRVRARQAVQIPADDDLFRWKIEAPFGKEVVKVIAATEPIDPLAEPSLAKAFFNSLSSERLKGVEFALGDREPAGWAEDQIEIVTQPRDAALAASGAKRWGVFFGVANYEFNAEAEQISDGKSHLNLPACHRDARQMADALREVGQLSEVLVYTNERATRRNMELAITRWLSAVSRPGDTVVIFFSGHGGQVADDNGDEPDGKDEILIPYDYMNAGILAALVKQADENKLPARLAPRVRQALEMVRRAGSVERGSLLLERQAGISDDLFGHWLQRLAGRQVVVILDACHSGGFATQEKGLGDGPPVSFDFLDQEMGRLKDLGQRDTALLSACRAQEKSGFFADSSLSLLTKCLLDSVMHASEPLTLKQGFADCQVSMHQYFVEVNRVLTGAGKPPLTEYRPFLVDYCVKSPLLKP